MLNKIMADKHLRRLFGYFLSYKKDLFVASIFMMGSASMSTLTATLLGTMTDKGFVEREAWVIFGAPAALIAVTAFFALCTVMSTYLMARISQKVLAKIRTQLFDGFLHWPSGAYQQYNSGMVASKFVNEAAFALGSAAQSIIVLVRDVIQTIALLGVLLWYNWQLTIVAFVVAPLLAYILKLISKRMKRIVTESQQTMASMISRVQESYTAQKIVKINDTYEYEERRFDSVNQSIARLALKAIQAKSISTPATQVVIMVAVAFVVATALIEAQHGLLTIGEFITFLTALLLLREPIQKLAGLNATFASISAAAGSIFEMLDVKTENDRGNRKIDHCKGEIVFDKVTLRYPDQEQAALKDVNLTIQAGTHFALVGHSGSGKTTLTNLLPRFLEPTEGRIALDGIDIQDLTLASLREQIAFVSQDIDLFDDTIRANVAYGMTDVSDEDIMEALAKSALRDFVCGLPQGLDTRVGEHGNLLSGGQKQRMSIARAFLKNAPILIFDEATSALDSESEELIKASIDVLAKDKTMITVAHRFSTIENADKVAVLSNGEVVELGSPAELIEKNGMYAHLLRLQTGM